MTQLETSTLALSYDDSGSGDPVLLLHGWPDSARGWSAVRAGLLADGYRVITPDLRGSGGTRFRDRTSFRDGSAAALARDALDLVDGLGLTRFAVVGHDWGARTAYTLGAAAPERLSSISALSVAYQPRGEFEMPAFPQVRLYWYQWFMYLDAGAEALRADPEGYARIQWNTWSPPGWFDDAEFATTARSFTNPDWVDITLHSYRSRFGRGVPRDAAYDDVRAAVSATEHIAVPTLMIQGGADTCTAPESSLDRDGYFDDYRRVVLDGVGHFPHRESPDRVLDEVRRHLTRNS